jgi:predicted nuclease of predicted toxin-antitoxin system
VRYLADVHISPLTVRREILGVAREQRAVLITADLDFSALIATSGETGPSLISLRLAFSTPDRVTAVLEYALPRIEPDLERGVIASIDETSIRVRPLPIL